MEVRIKSKNLWIWMGLLTTLITAFVMVGVVLNGWVNWDDPIYVLNNYWVQNLSLYNIWNMFTHVQVNGSYNPLVQLSWAIDYQLYGNNPMGFHVTNLICHLMITFWIYWFTKELSSNLWIAVIVGVLFGIHPVQVEVVAWISARKDLICYLFFVPAMISWLYYLRSSARRTKYYTFAFFMFVGALMSKGVAVTLPLVLLLIDWKEGRRDYQSMVLEKLPFWVLSILIGIVAIVAQPESIVGQRLELLSFSQRIYLALYEIGIYSWHLVAPIKLSAYYPFPFSPSGSMPINIYIIALVVVVCLGALLKLVKAETVRFGLLFFLINVLLVLQLIPFGQAFMADRYLYLSSFGIFLIIGYVIVQILARFSEISLYKWIVVGAIFVGFLGIGISTKLRIVVWENGYTLWTDVIKKYPDFLIGYMNRADYFRSQNQLESAWKDYELAVSKRFEHPGLYNDIGMMLQEGEQFDAANEAYTRALQIDSTYSRAYLNRGINAMGKGDTLLALNDFNMFIRLDSRQSLGYVNRGVLFESQKKYLEAINDYNKALEYDPGNIVYLKYRAVALQSIGDYSASFRDLEQALASNPNYGPALYWRAKCQAAFGEYDRAMEDLISASKNGYSVDQTEIKLLQDLQLSNKN